MADRKSNVKKTPPTSSAPEKGSLDTKKKLTVPEANKLKAEQEKAAAAKREADAKKIAEARAKLPQEPIKQDVLKALSEIKAINTQEYKKIASGNRTFVCTNCVQLATFSIPAGDMDNTIFACSEKCLLQTFQVQLLVWHSRAKENNQPERASELLRWAEKVEATKSLLQNDEQKDKPIAAWLCVDIEAKEKELKKAGLAMKAQKDEISAAFESKKNEEGEKQAKIRKQLQAVLDVEMLKIVKNSEESTYGERFEELVREYIKNQQKNTDEARHITIRLITSKTNAKNFEEASKMDLKKAVEALDEDFFGNPTIKPFYEGMDPLIKKRRKLQEKIEVINEEIATCNELAMATQCDEVMKPAEIITKIMTMFTNNVKIGEVESEKFALHLKQQTEARDLLKEIFKELLKHESVSSNTELTEWSEAHMPIAPAPEGIWMEHFELMERALRRMKGMADFVSERDECFELATTKIFEEINSKAQDSKELAKEKQRGRAISKAFDDEKNAHDFKTKEKMAEYRKKAEEAANLTAEYKTGYDEAMEELETMKSLRAAVLKIAGNGPKRGSPGGPWEQAGPKKKQKAEEKIPNSFFATYKNENSKDVPYCHYQFTKYPNGCYRGVKCEHAETHGMEDPHPTHFSRKAANEARAKEKKDKKAKGQKANFKKPASEKPSVKLGSFSGKPLLSLEASEEEDDPETEVQVPSDVNAGNDEEAEDDGSRTAWGDYE